LHTAVSGKMHDFVTILIDDVYFVCGKIIRKCKSVPIKLTGRYAFALKNIQNMELF
jgi:hypothetical protein